MKEWLISFEGICQIDADTPEEAIKILRNLNPHDGRVYDDKIDILRIECVSD